MFSRILSLGPFSLSYRFWGDWSQSVSEKREETSVMTTEMFVKGVQLSNIFNFLIFNEKFVSYRLVRTGPRPSTFCLLCTANCRKHCRVCQVCLYITAVTTVNEIFASLPASTWRAVWIKYGRSLWEKRLCNERKILSHIDMSCQRPLPGVFYVIITHSGRQTATNIGIRFLNNIPSVFYVYFIYIMCIRCMYYTWSRHILCIF